jgi:2-methylisocitrate lyase-like PEP mutase family enzyme
MVIARMESLIAGLGQDECLRRALASVKAGADGIMIHSKEKSPAEVLEVR